MAVKKSLSIVLAGALASVTVHAGEASAPPAKPAATAPAAAPAAPASASLFPTGDAPAAAKVSVPLVRVVLRLPEKAVWATMRSGSLCLGDRPYQWTGAQRDLPPPVFRTAFAKALKPYDMTVPGEQDSLFETKSGIEDLVVGAVITDLSISGCLPRAGFNDQSTIHGDARMTVEWQVYSTLRKSIVYTGHSSGTFSQHENGPGGINGLLAGAFGDAATSLAHEAAFRQAFMAGALAPGQTVRPNAQTSIDLNGARKATNRPISEAVASVVMVNAGASLGSGFVVSDDGYVITDQHVVGDAKAVTIRWSDGIETTGAVIRGDKVRDVAIIKTSARGRAPLRLRREPLSVGDAVFAIGAPLDQKFQSTVTRGVLSAFRTFEGLNFLQSDAAVNHGSSGGPLLDDKGAVVGITESGFSIQGAPEGINLFIPIGDALDFLSAEPK